MKKRPEYHNPPPETPSAFIPDQKTMDYLVERWKKYAQDEGRDHNIETYFGYTHSTEVFKRDPEPNVSNDLSYLASRRYTLTDQKIPGLFRESAEQMHGVNFFDEIEKKKKEKEASGDNSPVSILISGGDVGFFNDELRSKFGDKVDVSGTTLELSRARKRKKRFIKLIKNGKIQLTPEIRKYLTDSLSEEIDPRDSKWRSVLQMKSAEPEFDKIVDTCGELLYSDDSERPEIFQLTFKAFIAKLNFGGKLYIAELPSLEQQQFVERYCEEKGLLLEKKQYEDRNQNLRTNFIITKPSKG